MCTANEVVSLLPLLTLCYIIKYIIYEPFTFNESGVLPIFYPHFSILLPHCPLSAACSLTIFNAFVARI